MSVADEGDDRNSQQPAAGAERLGQDGRRPAERVSRLGVDDEDVVRVERSFHMAEQEDVGGEFPLADAADVPKQPFAADEAVDRDDIVRPRGPDRRRGDLEVEEGVVVAEEDIGGLETLDSLFGYHRAVFFHVGHAEHIGQRPEEPSR